VIGKDRIEYPSREIPRKRRLRLVYLLCRWFLPPTRPLPQNMTFYGGLNWWNITRETAEHIFAYLRSNPGFPRIFRYTKSSDEIFFQTILLNWPDGNLENNDLRCMFWDGRRNEYPAFLRNEDFDEIKDSGMFFARKIHPFYSLELIDRIDAELLGLH
jgi:hypothetical protein